MELSEARRMATRIQLYWVSRGLSGVHVWTEPLDTMADGERVTIYQIRSNIPERIRVHSNSHSPV